MTITTTAYAHDAEGKLMAFEVTEATSYEHAINSVKSQTGVGCALCLVRNRPVANTQPGQEAA